MPPKKKTELILNNNNNTGNNIDNNNNNDGYLSDNENLDDETVETKETKGTKRTKGNKETKATKIDMKAKKSDPKKKKAKRKIKTKAMSKKHNMTEFLKDMDVQELIQTKMMQKAKKEKKIRKPRKSLKKHKKKKNNIKEKQHDEHEESSDDGFPKKSKRYGYHYNTDSMKNEVLDSSKHFNIPPKSGYESETEDEEEKDNKQVLDMINPFTESMKLITRFRKPEQTSKNQKFKNQKLKKQKMKRLLTSLTRKNPILTRRNMSKMSKKLNKMNPLNKTYQLRQQQAIPQSKSYSKRTGFQYMSSINNQGKMKELGNFMVDNSKNPYILKGQIKNGKIIQKKVTRN